MEEFLDHTDTEFNVQEGITVFLNGAGSISIHKIYLNRDRGDNGEIEEDLFTIDISSLPGLIKALSALSREIKKERVK